ncbi:hypothetical protein, partial [uncultured Alistipes sp.]|uniref:hypothetical protein n=1 Tax=uncultured Alistipes sp. TaxID=538949 RepID=UPI0026292A1B
YTLTLSFTHSAPLLSQLEALADGSEVGESGGGTENENPESGDNKRYKMNNKVFWCQEYRWVKVSDGSGGHNWELQRIGDGPHEARGTECVEGTELESCTPYDPCNPAKPC